MTHSSDDHVDDDGPPPLTADHDLAPGYRVVAHLRRGADLDVYDLWSDERACRCVGKTLRPDRMDDRGTRRRLLQEGRFLTRLAHPHIVRAYETLVEPHPVVILETLPGQTLAHLIDHATRRLAVSDIAVLGLHLCSAIHYLHRQQLLHLDLKPSNIVVSDGIAKVLDLSLARPPGRTRGGIGTPGYMAPEQADGGMVGPSTDVWGIGAVLYEAATGEPPLDTGDATDTKLAEQATGPVDPIRRHRRLPAAFAAIVDACLVPEPSERPRVAELSEALGRFA